MTLSPRILRYGVVGLVGAAVLALALVAPGRKMPGSDAPQTARVDGLILSGDTRAASLEAVAAQINELHRRLDGMERDTEATKRARERELAATVERLRREIASEDATRRRVAQAELNAIRAEVRDLGLSVVVPSPGQVEQTVAAGVETPAPAVEPAPVAMAAPADDLPVPRTVRLPRGDAPAGEHGRGEAPAAGAEPVAAPAAQEAERRSAATPAPPPERFLTEGEVLALFRREQALATPAALGPGPAPAPAGRAPGGSLRLIEAAAAPATTGPRNAAGGSAVFLPAGSILSGVILAGLDAPSGAAAQTNPVPVLMRLKHEAILPNNYAADVRECFALLSAYGELSAERAQMRGEQLSCILRDGTVIQQPLKAHAVGEDGKAGVRGRVVTRQGAFIGRAITVGILDGVAQAFRRSVTVNVGSAGSASDAAVSGFGAGFGSALDRIASWYLDQASNLFPVIEIDNGRAIDLVLTSGMDFRVDL